MLALEGILMEPMVEIKHLKKYFPIESGFLKKTVRQLKAVDDVSFTIQEGETFGLVGESGWQNDHRKDSSNSRLQELSCSRGKMSPQYVERPSMNTGKIFRPSSKTLTHPSTAACESGASLENR